MKERNSFRELSFVFQSSFRTKKTWSYWKHPGKRRNRHLCRPGEPPTACKLAEKRQRYLAILSRQAQTTIYSKAVKPPPRWRSNEREWYLLCPSHLDSSTRTRKVGRSSRNRRVFHPWLHPWKLKNVKREGERERETKENKRVRKSRECVYICICGRKSAFTHFSRAWNARRLSRRILLK